MRAIVLKVFVLLSLLLATTCCQQATIPGTPEEPDTARSNVSAMINGQLWEVRTPDTLSKGTYSSDGVLVRESPVRSTMECVYYEKDNQSIYKLIRFALRKKFNLSSKDLRAPDNSTITLRSWFEDELDVSFVVPRTTLTIPAKLDTLNWCDWNRYHVEESGYFDGRNNQNFIISSFYATISKMRFDKLDAMPTKSVIKAELLVDYYDKTKDRIAGRFTIILADSTGKQVFTLSDGKFENVRILGKLPTLSQ